MVSIKMTRNKHGSPDGHTVRHYEQGQTYDVPEDLAKLFVEVDKVAEYVEGEKAIEAASKNKAEKVVKNKAEKVESEGV